MNKLVSIVSPCYNAEKFIDRYFKAIIGQTYRPIELILVNDGSTDNTEKKILEYEEILKKNNISFKFRSHEDLGVAAAINTGLQLVTGEYLVWPDPDDILLPQSIEKRVAFLEKHTECGFVVSDGHSCRSDDLNKPIRFTKAICPKNGHLFDNIVNGKVVFNPSGYMIRFSIFEEMYPDRKIFESRYGQNIQMLMPMAYKSRCGHMEEDLYCRVEDENSLSQKLSREDGAWKKKIVGLQDVYIETLKKIGGDALAYIPYVYYRNYRIERFISKKVSKNEHRIHKKLFGKSSQLVIKEFLKGIVR